MNILITMPEGELRSIFFPEEVIAGFRKVGNVVLNDTGRRFTEEELKKHIKGIDICVTHWLVPRFTDEVLSNADSLRMIAHAAGSVAGFVTESVYEKGIKVCSANSVMAWHVAEGVLAYMLAALRMIPQHSLDMKNGRWNRRVIESRSLFDEKIGLIGLGTVGLYLLQLLKPFKVKLKVYDPYLPEGLLDEYPEAELASLEETLAWGNIISIHASRTPETYHMINSSRLKLIKDGALLVNTARGAIIDEEALIGELSTGRINAILDVYDKEPLPGNSGLLHLDNVILMPHMAGATAKEVMSFEMIKEIERFINGETLQYEIPVEKFRLMTR
jgi:phosphoglycerate dehydrogenase-like enzyme